MKIAKSRRQTMRPVDTRIWALIQQQFTLNQAQTDARPLRDRPSVYQARGHQQPSDTKHSKAPSHKARAPGQSAAGGRQPATREPASSEDCRAEDDQGGREDTRAGNRRQQGSSRLGAARTTFEHKQQAGPAPDDRDIGNRHGSPALVVNS